MVVVSRVKNMLELVIGVVLIMALSWLSLNKRYIDLGGLIIAIIMGILSLICNFSLFLLLVIFFLSSSFLTKLGYNIKYRNGVAESKFGRSYKQVLGAGLVPIIFVLLELITSKFFNLNFMNDLFIMGFLGSLNTSMADTWAVEIGVLSSEKPRLITNLKKKVPKGVSGGVTILGEIASFIGSLVFAFFSSLFTYCGFLKLKIPSFKVFLVTLIAGFLGEKIDSIIGACFQRKFFCEKCKVMSDYVIHKCGFECKFVYGVKWFTNEITNIIATFVGGLIAILLIILA